MKIKLLIHNLINPLKERKNCFLLLRLESEREVYVATTLCKAYVGTCPLQILKEKTFQLLSIVSGRFFLTYSSL